MGTILVGQIGQSAAAIAVEYKFDIGSAPVPLLKAWGRTALATQLKLGPVVTNVQVLNGLFVFQPQTPQVLKA